MEFNEKLQQLRAQKGITQEELAQALFVSRTAISKWESGRGYPNIDSLKQLAKFFGVSIDELLSTGEVLTIAEEDNRQKQNRLRGLVFALLDVSIIMFIFLPFFRQEKGEIISAVSLLSLSGVAPYMKAAYFAVVLAIAALGVLSIALHSCRSAVWQWCRPIISLILNAAGVLVFILSPQPYAAAFLFVFLLIKVLMLIKKQ